jgi:hypothetical protein
VLKIISDGTPFGTRVYVDYREIGYLKSFTFSADSSNQHVNINADFIQPYSDEFPEEMKVTKQIAKSIATCRELLSQYTPTAISTITSANVKWCPDECKKTPSTDCTQGCTYKQEI